MLSPLVSLSPNNVLFTNNLWTRLNSMFENSKMKNLNLSLTMKFPTSLLRNVNDIPSNNVDVRLVMNGLTEVEMNSIRIISHSSVLATRSLGGYLAIVSTTFKLCIFTLGSYSLNPIVDLTPYLLNLIFNISLLDKSGIPKSPLSLDEIDNFGDTKISQEELQYRRNFFETTALEWLPIMDLNYPEDIQLNEFERNSKKRKIEDPINLQVIVLAIGNKNGEITFWGFPLCFELKSQFGDNPFFMGKLSGHQSWITKILWISNNSLLTCSADGSVSIWDLDFSQFKRENIKEIFSQKIQFSLQSQLFEIDHLQATFVTHFRNQPQNHPTRVLIAKPHLVLLVELDQKKITKKNFFENTNIFSHPTCGFLNFNGSKLTLFFDDGEVLSLDILEDKFVQNIDFPPQIASAIVSTKYQGDSQNSLKFLFQQPIYSCTISANSLFLFTIQKTKLQEVICCETEEVQVQDLLKIIEFYMSFNSIDNLLELGTLSYLLWDVAEILKVEERRNHLIAVLEFLSKASTKTNLNQAVLAKIILHNLWLTMKDFEIEEINSLTNFQEDIWFWSFQKLFLSFGLEDLNDPQDLLSLRLMMSLISTKYSNDKQLTNQIEKLSTKYPQSNEKFLEFCSICKAGIPIDSYTKSICVNGHKWSRCPSTLLTISNPRQSQSCVVCNFKFLDPSSFTPTSKLHNHLERSKGCCFCFNSLTDIHF